MAATSTVRWNGADFTPTDVEGAAELIASLVGGDGSSAGSGRHVHLCNSWTIALAESDERLAAALRDDRAVNLVDGVPLGEVLARRAGQQRTTSRGPALFVHALPQYARLGRRQLFFGGTEEVLARIHQRLSADGVPAEDLQSYAPPMRPLDEAAIEDYIARIRDADADLVWIGLGTPKQDILAAEAVRRTGVTAVCVGAAFDFLAGTVKEAPGWVQDTGFEWLYRFACEPRRLWRRYTVGNAKFMKVVLREWRTER